MTVALGADHVAPSAPIRTALNCAEGVDGARRTHPRGVAVPVDRLTQARKAAGLTITALARRLHLSRPLVSMWERGTRPIAQAYWPALQTILHLTEDELHGIVWNQRPTRTDAAPLPSLGAIRRSRGLTQSRLAADVGVGQTTLASWETSGARASPAMMAQLSYFLICSIEDLKTQPAVPPDPRPLRALRKAAGMTVREAASSLGMCVTTLNRYEAGRRSVPVAVARRMALIYRQPTETVRSAAGNDRHRIPPLPWEPSQLPGVLTALRESAGFTKAHLGRLVDRSPQVIAAWEWGQRTPSSTMARRLEVVFGLPRGLVPT